MQSIGILAFAFCFLSALGQLPSQDILALLEFKKVIKHDLTGFVLQSWNEKSIDFNGCPSSWNGIMCNGGNVAVVVLDNLGLSANTDLSVFSNLTMLVKLSMSNNFIIGKLPDNIGDFKSLEYLDLSNNMFFSTLPLGIGNLGCLKNFSLAGNNFSGSILDAISGLQSVQSLDLSRNSFTGELPSSLMTLMSLVSLNLSLNGFTMGIPKGFELMPNLESSSLQQKFLPGLSDTIKYLNLIPNRLTGSLVGEAQAFGSLNVLDLSYNQLSGELPAFDFVYDLEVLKHKN